MKQVTFLASCYTYLSLRSFFQGNEEEKNKKTFTLVKNNFLQL